MLSTFDAKGSVMTAKQTPRCARAYVKDQAIDAVQANFCVNSQTPHANKNKRHKPYFFTRVVTVALSSSKILTDGKLHWPSGSQQKHFEANILCSHLQTYFKNTFFSHETCVTTIAETAALNCRRPC